MFRFKNLQGSGMCAILPHEVFAAFFNDYGPCWEKVMLVGKKTCSEMSDFWAHAKTHACVQDLPAGSLDRVVPLAVHGDEVPVVGRGKIWCKQALVVSWYSMWATHLKICIAFEAKTEALYWLQTIRRRQNKTQS